MRKLHLTIKKVGEDMPKLSYNTAIAAMMEYMNVLRRAERVPHRAEVAPLVQLVAPVRAACGGGAVGDARAQDECV
jgi:leucyl-tRNA synthetase